VFLKDGSSLVSYGELARVGDRVVFSMPTTASTSDPQLHLVNLAADNVDWDRTSRYADAARANQYLTNQAAYDYALLSNDVAPRRRIPTNGWPSSRRPKRHSPLGRPATSITGPPKFSRCSACSTRRLRTSGRARGRAR
jgi:hypothetical protein